jgi:hypothetical protein
VEAYCHDGNLNFQSGLILLENELVEVLGLNKGVALSAGLEVYIFLFDLLMAFLYEKGE